MRKTVSLLFTFAVVALALLAGLSRQAAAQDIPFLDLTVSPFQQIVMPNDTAIFDVVLTNNTTSTAYFQITSFNDGFPVTPDVTTSTGDTSSFGTNQTLDPGQSLTLSGLFQAQVAPNASSASYDATAELGYDLYDDNTFTTTQVDGVTATGNYNLTVNAAPVPETSSIVGMTTVLGLAGVGLVKRSRTV